MDIRILFDYKVCSCLVLFGWYCQLLMDPHGLFAQFFRVIHWCLGNCNWSTNVDHSLDIHHIFILFMSNKITYLMARLHIIHFKESNVSHFKCYYILIPGEYCCSCFHMNHSYAQFWNENCNNAKTFKINCHMGAICPQFNLCSSPSCLSGSSCLTWNRLCDATQKFESKSKCFPFTMQTQIGLNSVDVIAFAFHIEFNASLVVTRHSHSTWIKQDLNKTDAFIISNICFCFGFNGSYLLLMLNLEYRGV